VLTHFERSYRNKYTEQDTLVEGISGAIGITTLHVDPNSLRVWKSEQDQASILQHHGYPPFNDPINVPLRIRELLLDDLDPEHTGLFTFKPGELYLAYTAESVTIPPDQIWRMRTFFTVDDCYTLPLTTNISAPNLKPHSKGPQTYEIRNFGANPLTIPINRLTCSTAIIPVQPTSKPPSGNFSIQSGQRPTLGRV
jgi:hypothetical protein